MLQIAVEDCLGLRLTPERGEIRRVKPYGIEMGSSFMTNGKGSTVKLNASKRSLADVRQCSCSDNHICKSLGGVS